MVVRHFKNISQIFLGHFQKINALYFCNQILFYVMIIMSLNQYDEYQCTE
jgi:hypothetical protein